MCKIPARCRLAAATNYSSPVPPTSAAGPRFRSLPSDRNASDHESPWRLRRDRPPGRTDDGATPASHRRAEAETAGLRQDPGQDGWVAIDPKPATPGLIHVKG